MLRTLYCVALALLAAAAGWAQAGAYTTQFRVSPPAPTAPNPFSNSSSRISVAPFGSSTPQRFSAPPFPDADRNPGLFIRNRMVAAPRRSHPPAGSPNGVDVPSAPAASSYPFCPYDYNLLLKAPAPPRASGTPAHGPPPEIETSANINKKPSNKPAGITFGSDPPGAGVYVDGNFIGHSPYTLKLAPGLHTVYIQQWGYQAWQRTLTLAPGGKTNLRATLQKQ